MTKKPFFIVGPTASGKSEIAADVACEIGAEIVSADAFQIYEGFFLLTAKPDASTLAKSPHHLVGTVSILEEMNADKFSKLALREIHDIHSREKPAMVVSGSGLYIKALTHGLSELPAVDQRLRAELSKMSLDQLRAKLSEVDPVTARKIDMKNRRRVSRALEICLQSGKSMEAALSSNAATAESAKTSPGVFVLRDREELHGRISRRVEQMFELGVVDEVRNAGKMSQTASRMIGLREIQQHLEGKMSIVQCIAAIQQATRQYAKRQLTWFRHQTNFQSLNLSRLTHNEAVERIAELANHSAVGEEG